MAWTFIIFGKGGNINHGKIPVYPDYSIPTTPYTPFSLSSWWPSLREGWRTKRHPGTRGRKNNQDKVGRTVRTAMTRKKQQ